MRIEEDIERVIHGLKCMDEGENYRLTFNWPVGVQQVYIYKKPGGLPPATPDEQSIKNGRLLTLHEYRKQGGYLDTKTPGTSSYYVYPFERAGSENICYASPDNLHIITVTGQVNIHHTITARPGPRGYKQYDICLTSSRPIPPETVFCVKKEGHQPTSLHDGTIYPFYEPIKEGESLTRQVQTKKTEYISLFINESSKSLYQLQSTIRKRSQTWDYSKKEKPK